MANAGTADFLGVARPARHALIALRHEQVSADLRWVAGAIALFERARAGYLIRVRAQEVTSAALFELIHHPVALERLADDDPTGQGAHLHVSLTLGYVPQLPAALATWRPPRGYGYRDLRAPRGVFEAMERVDDLERTVWRLAGGRDVREDPLRRLYAFFEAGAIWAEGQRLRLGA